jgi:hypothetical protein
MFPHGLRLWFCHNRIQIFDARFANFRQRSEMRQKFLRRLESHTSNFGEFGRQRSAATAFTMESDGKPVTLVANLLNYAKDRRSAFENDRFIFAARNLDNFFLLGDARERLIDDIQLVERELRGV